MKTIAADLQTDIEAGTICTLMMATRKDGTVYYWTDNDQALTVAGNTYQPAAGMGSIKLDITNNAEVSTTQTKAAWLPIITEADVLAGLFDDCELQIGMCSWVNPSYGAVWLFSGQLSLVTATQDGFQATVQSSLWVLQRPLGIFMTPNCRHTLGSSIDPQGVSGCGVNLANYTHAGTVTAVQNQMFFTVDIPTFNQPLTPNTPTGLAATVTQNITGQFLAPGIYYYSVSALVGPQESVTGPMIEVTVQPNNPPNGGGIVNLSWNAVAGATSYNIYGNTGLQTLLYTTTGTSWSDNGSSGSGGFGALYGDYFSNGIITMTSGAANNLQSQVRTMTGNTMQMVLPFGRDVAVGDTFNVTAGCWKNVGICQNKFNNIANFGGFPDLIPQRNWM